MNPVTLQDVAARTKSTAVYALAFLLGGLAAMMLLASDEGSHLVFTERDCVIQHSFVADGVRYYCAPWNEVGQ